LGVALVRRLCEAAVVAAGFLLGLRHITDFDVWTHLAHGRALLAARGLPAHEPFTFPSAAMPYYNTEWLFGVVLYAAHAVGGPAAIIGLKAVLLALVAWLLWRTAMLAPNDRNEPSPLRPVVALATVLGGLLAMRYRFVERPDVALMVFIAATVYALDAYVVHGRRRALYLLVPMTVIWANVHPSVIVAAGPFGGVLAGGILLHVLSRWRGAEAPGTPTRAQLRLVAAVGGAVVLASLVNPYGWDAITLPFRLAGSEWFTQEVGELQRPRLGAHPIAVALAVLFVAVLALNVRQAPLVAALMVAPFAWLAVSGTRFVFLFPLVATPLVARGLMKVLTAPRVAGWPRLTLAAASSAAGAVVLATGLAVANVPPLAERTATPGVGVDRRAIPEAALAYLDRVGATGRIFNAFHFGGYVAWRDFPRRAPIVDGRGWVPTGLLEEIHFARVYPAHLERLRSTYGFEAAVMDYPSFAGEPLDEVSPGADGGLASPAWALVYWDDVALVYLRRAGPFAAIAARDEYRHLRPANGAAALTRALQGGAPVEAVRAEIARNLRETGSAIAQTLAGAVALHVRDWDDALARFASVREGPGRLYGLQGEAVAAGAKGDFTRALDAYARLLAEADDATVAYYAGVVALGAGREADAVRYLERARRRDPALTPVFAPLVEAYRRRGDADGVRSALTGLEHARTLSRAREHATRGRARLRDGRVGEAVVEFQAALALDATDGRARSGLGHAYAALGRLDEATAAQQAALALNPELASAHYGLAVVADGRGDSAAARRHFETFVRLEPRSYAAWQIRQRLGSGRTH
jgi:tetratricopeptide (TPR) repeat protein